jgi:hypothetical protein
MTTSQVVTPDPRELLVAETGTVHNRAARLVREGGREVVRLDAQEGDGLAWWHDVTVDTGTIACEVRGKNVLQRSFVGVAFHGAREGDGVSYEAVYFRPFNFVAEEPVRRRHMVQYVFPPEFPWQRLREERPDQFEAAVDPVPDPDDWFAARIEVAERTVRVYVAGSEIPSLEVQRLSDRRGGWVGFWVGNGSDGDFAALTLAPAPRS